MGPEMLEKDKERIRDIIEYCGEMHITFFDYMMLKLVDMTHLVAGTLEDVRLEIDEVNEWLHGIQKQIDILSDTVGRS